MRSLPVLAAALAAMVALGSGCAGAAASKEPAPARTAIPGEYVFTVEPGTDPRFLQGLLSDLAPRRIQGIGKDSYLVVFAEDPGLPRLSLRTGERIRSVEPHYTPAPTPAPAR